jgi:hypothetical protein
MDGWMGAYPFDAPAENGGLLELGRGEGLGGEGLQGVHHREATVQLTCTAAATRNQF